MYSDSLIVVIMDVLKSWAPDRRMRSSAELSLSLLVSHVIRLDGRRGRRRRENIATQMMAMMIVLGDTVGSYLVRYK